ncbi:putative disease resistance RPP13-like protein 1 [Morella rubra]|uniref:Putative disease resistance RPP13-like protein 1 n=1 Tax=Morella rubra TaxID=262757 RepID=A0A6A1W0X5_9ROSI|nr:putative disease resistance RPP13-like protein 1 [Morella rubra]KAB1218872.1 putative disease resistance RPP13-like protein 1 [Morella rubra]KAB1218905.1 putative disease resistance RPP13-like protein 1 [Morella rubra]
MAEVGVALLSASLNVLFESMASREVVDFIRGGNSVSDGLLDKLKITLRSVNSVLEDAEEKQFTKPAVRDWLDDLKDVVYDAEGILDEIATKALRRKLDAEIYITTGKVRNYISTFLTRKIEPKIKKIHDKLEFLAKQKDLIGLQEGAARNQSERLPTTSFVEPSCIFGRDNDKEAIINLLLSGDTRADDQKRVIAVVGMGGIGKTTLAQLVYNDRRVKEHFELAAWFCVSDEFVAFQLMKSMIGAITSSPCNIEDPNLLQVTLQKKLTGKKFLLVLDDVWTEKRIHQEFLTELLQYGAEGSKIIITTRNESVARAMHASASHPLKELPDGDCWSLFAKHALCDGSFDAHPKLEEIGRQLVKKCKGLPLAIKAIGALLWSKLEVDEWNKILRSELWDLPIGETNILPALGLSYKFLSSHLKRCFAYCSIFPKDYAFRKDHVILLWLAEGFLEQSRNETMEEVGDRYFFALVSRSLFQQQSGNKQRFIMHDLVNGLAKYVAGQFSFTIEGDSSDEIVNATRHSSYYGARFNTSNQIQEALHKTKQLRTFLALDWDVNLDKKLIHNLLPTLKCLRVFSLSYCRGVTELPNSISKIEHLRYLNLSFTRIRRLPNSICNLCNLQTLILRHTWVVALPRDMWKLVNLRHLDFIGTPIKEMPKQLGALKSLHTLTAFIASKGSGSGIQELGKLANLQGTLSILELQNVVSAEDALNARLEDKDHLKKLVLEWKADRSISKSERAIFDNLRPHSNLRSLTINHYGGKSFPNWVGHHSFSNLVSLYFYKCKYCCSLPPVGQLPSLQELTIVGFDGVLSVGPEFYGSTGSSSMKPFGALKVLRFEQMLNWKKWANLGEENVEAFPHLEELYIENCPKLTGWLPVHNPSLARLKIIECWQLVASLPMGLVVSLPRAPAICELVVVNGEKHLLVEKLQSGMQRLEIKGFHELESLERMMDSNTCIEELEVRDCSELMSLSSSSLPSILKSLRITNCGKLELSMDVNYSSLETLWLSDSCDSLTSLPLDLFPKLKYIHIDGCSNLESLSVPEQHDCDLVTSKIELSSCPNFLSFPKGGLRAPNLTSLSIEDCDSLRSLPDKMHQLLLSLKILDISGCPVMEFFPEGGWPSNVTEIYIAGCDKLIANWMGWGLQNCLSLLELSIVSSKDVESFPKVGLLPTSLIGLEISDFPYLSSLDQNGLQHLTSLEELEIYQCPKLRCMPEEGLPASLSNLRICHCPSLKYMPEGALPISLSLLFIDSCPELEDMPKLPPSLAVLEIERCPVLKKQYQSKKGEAWDKVAHVQRIVIDGDLIQMPEV